MNRRLLLFVVMPLLLFGGCAHVLSREARLEVDPTVDFAQVKANPEAQVGKTLLLGGMIVDNRLSRQGTTLELLLYSVDRWGEPRRADGEGGRFLARAGRFLDPEIFKPGTFVTLTGTVEGVETRPLHGYDYEYVYPVLRLNEVYVWRQYYEPVYPYGYYDPYPPLWPYRYPYYFGDPFWYHDPFWPHPHRSWPPGWHLR